MPTPHAERLTALRALIRREGIAAWVQPVNDEFQSEYVPAYAERLPWLCGFTGSAGLAVIPADASLSPTLFVDGRYTLQARDELGAEWSIVNSGDTPTSAWIAAHFPEGARIGCDAWLHTHRQITQWEAAFAPRHIAMTPRTGNLIDTIWSDRPATPDAPLLYLPESLTGRSAAEKIARCTDFLRERKLAALAITQPDTLCWLLNLRGGDIPFNPLLLAYGLVLADGRVLLLTHPRNWTDTDTQALSALGVTPLPLTAWFASPALAEHYALTRGTVGIDPSQAAHGWWRWAAESGVRLSAHPDPLLPIKAAKTTAEQEGMRAAHRMDGLAVTRFLARLPELLRQGVDELGVVAELEACRALNPAYRGASFATIAGSGPNGAIVHYRANAHSSRRLREGELLLLDSGGQYLEGTTDITRTVALGTATKERRDRYTRVLKGHIALASAVFPQGTTGQQLDVLARRYLWEVGCDYDHGTGHGVGSFLCVHEGPQRISKKGSDSVLVPGMVLSNEPGYYKAGEYGIRIENLVMVVPTAHGLAFETLTLAPIDTSLIDPALLTSDEAAWLNRYHDRVREAHIAHLSPPEQEWLRHATAALPTRKIGYDGFFCTAYAVR